MWRWWDISNMWAGLRSSVCDASWSCRISTKWTSTWPHTLQTCFNTTPRTTRHRTPFLDILCLRQMNLWQISFCCPIQEQRWKGGPADIRRAPEQVQIQTFGFWSQSICVTLILDWRPSFWFSLTPMLGLLKSWAFGSMMCSNLWVVTNCGALFLEIQCTMNRPRPAPKMTLFSLILSMILHLPWLS